LGFGVGFATQATPLNLSEMAPFNLRGGALNILSSRRQLGVGAGRGGAGDGGARRAAVKTPQNERPV
jgi:hypothetical protein